MKPINLFLENMEEAIRLLEIHERITPDGPGRRHGVEILHKSNIVLITACWESFLEETAKASFSFLVNNTSTPQLLPKNILQSVAKNIIKHDHELKIWEVAGDGWKSVLEEYQDEIIKKYLGRFNSPKYGNIDNLFSELIGLKNISNKWQWKGMNYKSSQRKLNKFVNIRHEIAHQVKTSSSVSEKNVRNYGVFTVNLAVKTSNTVRSYIYKITGKYPWERE